MGQNDDEMELCLKWNNFECTVTSAFHNFHGAGELVDVTLAAEGQQLKAHRLVLAACSPYFRDVFKVRIRYVYKTCIIYLTLYNKFLKAK